MSASEALLRQAGDAFVPVRRRAFRRLLKDRTAMVGLVIIVMVVGAFSAAAAAGAYGAFINKVAPLS